MIRVAVWGTGNMGSAAIRSAVAFPGLTLSGVITSSSAKAGRDAADFAGLDRSTGVRADTDVDAVLAGCDAVAYMADLPRHLMPLIDGAPYIRADPARAAERRAWLASLGPGPKIGLCWRSSLRGAHRDDRVPPVSAWRSLFAAFPDACFVNLQYDDPEGSSWGPAGPAAIHIPPALDQFDDLDGVAALMAGLDLVVTAPTAVASLAAALGRPTLRVLRGTDWSQFGSGRHVASRSLETVQLPREWYGDAAMAPVIAAVRAVLGRRTGGRR